MFYLTAIVLGSCLAAMSLGIFLTIKIFKIPDITTDGSYTLGAVVTATLLTQGWHSAAILPVVLIAGCLAGAFTGFIHTKLKIDTLLAGILVMTALYSVNLALLGRSNLPLINLQNIYTTLVLVANRQMNELMVAFSLIILCISLLAYTLKTDFGIAMRITGDSPTMASSNGVNINAMKMIGLAIGNALTAFSGFLVAQYQGFTDVNMGIGIVIVGLGSVLIADGFIQLLGVRNIFMQLFIVLIGSIIFQAVLAFTLTLGINPNMLKLVTASFVLFIVAITKLRKR